MQAKKTSTMTAEVKDQQHVTDEILGSLKPDIHS